MRTIAIGDIHGCRASLEALAEYAEFSADDTIITLGDVVNRGPDSKGVIEFLLELRDICTLISLMGNHELMLLSLIHGDADPDSDGFLSADDLCEEHVCFIRSFQPFHEAERHIFVHAGALPDTPMNQQPDHMLYWEKIEDRGPHMSGKFLVCGHTAQRSGEVLNLGHTVCIDTFAHGGGWLTALDVDFRCYWQANERGDWRMDVLEPV